MKTTDTTVLDEPKIHEPTDQAVIEPAIENRPRRATGVKEAKIYIDGKFYSEANAKISVLDHGLLYGDGIFEGIRFYNGRVFRLEEHLDRLCLRLRRNSGSKLWKPTLPVMMSSSRTNAF